MTRSADTQSSNSEISAKTLAREYAESLIVAVIVALVLRFFVISAYKIPTGSMVPTLKVGDFIFAYKLSYGVPIPFSNGRLGAKLPQRGDVVVFRYPGNESVNYVKRVVGLPGDQISVKNKKLYINEVAAEYHPISDEVIQDLPGREFYSASEEVFSGSSHLVIHNRSDEADFFGPIVVPPGHFFVMGDNRDSSDDSRYWGAVPIENLEGQVVVVWMSFDWLNRWGDGRYPMIRWDRLMHRVR